MNMPSDKTQADAGMTLIELILVLAVFALIATMSLQALSGTLRSRDRLVALDQKSKDITLALTLLRADLRAAVPLVFHAPDGQDKPAVLIPSRADGLALSLSGRLGLPGEKLAGLGRVIWRFDPRLGEISRQSWPVLIPADSTSLSPEVVLATGITGLEVRQLTPELRWITGPNPNVSGASGTLPRALNVIVTSAEFGPLSTLVSYP